MTIKINQMIREINTLYENIKNKYIFCIDTTKETTKVGGTYYGRTELLTTRGTHFEKTIGYEHHERYFNSYYDFVFKVGGLHLGDFFEFKDSFLQDFKQNLQEIMDKYEFQNGKCVIGNEEYHIRFLDQVAYGTNFSVYAGLQIKIKEDNQPTEYRIKREWIQKVI